MKNVVILHNIRSALNVGAIIRTVEGFGSEAVVFSGYTPRVRDERVLPHLREKLDKQIHKTALGAEKMVKNYAVEDILEEIRRFKNEGYTVVGLENNIRDERLVSICSEEFSQKLTEKNVLILGEEVGGISRELFSVIDVFAEIPMTGRKESFNVSVAAGIALFQMNYGRKFGK